VAKVKRQDIYFYVAVALALVVIGLSFVSKKGNDLGLDQNALRVIQVVQVIAVAVCIVLFILSFRQPLHRMSVSLVRERQEVAREKRRKKAHDR
jgi:hypothetical protein